MEKRETMSIIQSLKSSFLCGLNNNIHEVIRLQNILVHKHHIN